MDTILSDTDLSIISIPIAIGIRKDSRLRYLYDGKRTGKRGRPKKYDGKVDFKVLNRHYFKQIQEDKEKIMYRAIL